MSTGAKAALLEEYALVARALSAPARLMILEQLAQQERGVEALAARTGLTVANCSQHLQQLRQAGLVASRRERTAVIYRLTDGRILALMDLLREIAERQRAEVERILRGLADGEDPPEPVTRADLAARLAEGAVILLDVRPADEYAAGHIPGAINVAPDSVDRVIAGIGRDAQIVAYCRGPYCIYAHQAVAALRRRGLNARRLDGGLPEWREEGRPVAVAAA
jgi:ArsR family transcriptional regulator